MTLRTLNYGNYGIFLLMGHAGFCPSAVELCELRVWVGGFYGAVESALDGFCSNRGLMGCIGVSGV